MLVVIAGTRSAHASIWKMDWLDPSEIMKLAVSRNQKPRHKSMKIGKAIKEPAAATTMTTSMS